LKMREFHLIVSALYSISRTRALGYLKPKTKTKRSVLI
jgi:hypothetical protein